MFEFTPTQYREAPIDTPDIQLIKDESLDSLPYTIDINTRKVTDIMSQYLRDPNDVDFFTLNLKRRGTGDEAGLTEFISSGTFNPATGGISIFPPFDAHPEQIVQKIAQFDKIAQNPSEYVPQHIEQNKMIQYMKDSLAADPSSVFSKLAKDTLLFEGQKEREQYSAWIQERVQSSRIIPYLLDTSIPYERKVALVTSLRETANEKAMTATLLEEVGHALQTGKPSLKASLIGKLNDSYHALTAGGIASGALAAAIAINNLSVPVQVGSDLVLSAATLYGIKLAYENNPWEKGAKNWVKTTMESMNNESLVQFRYKDVQAQ